MCTAYRGDIKSPESILPSSRVTAFSVCVDFLGFVFVPESKRIVSVDDARQIASVLDENRPSIPLNRKETEADIGMGMAPWFTTHAGSIDRERRSRPLLVGVLKNETVETVREVVRRVPLNAVQFQAEEPVEFMQ